MDLPEMQIPQLAHGAEVHHVRIREIGPYRAKVQMSGTAEIEEFRDQIKWLKSLLALTSLTLLAIVLAAALTLMSGWIWPANGGPTC